MGYGAPVNLRRAALFVGVGLLLATVSSVAFLPRHASAVALTQAEAALPLLTAAPHQGAGGGVVIADTEEPTEAAGGNNVILLVAALGVLVGVLLVTRRKSPPDT